jgi:hypothetical protein
MTWLLNTVFGMENLRDQTVDNFLFMEEDYVVAPTVYSTVIKGLNAIDQFESETNGGFFGVGLEGKKVVDYFYVAPFTSGPMTMSRQVFAKLQTTAEDYCTVDDYNWDWSLVQTAYAGHLPHTMLVSGRPQVRHIGATGGMHSSQLTVKERRQALRSGEFDTAFEAREVYSCGPINPLKPKRQFGGWGHPADVLHCIDLFSNHSTLLQNQKFIDGHL